jgi:hypothetical protein
MLLKTQTRLFQKVGFVASNSINYPSRSFIPALWGLSFIQLKLLRLLKLLKLLKLL